MSNNSNEITVPITAPELSSESETDSYGYDGKIVHQPDYSVVVPVVSNLFNSDTGINARRFLQTAIALADDNNGRVVLLGIVDVVDETVVKQVREYAHSEDTSDGEGRSVPESVTDRQRELTQMVNVAKNINPDVPVRATVRTVTDTTQGILDALGSGGEMAVLLLRGTGFDEGWLPGKSTIDTVVEKAECDVFVENVGVREDAHALYVPAIEGHTVASLAESEAETIDSILLPVGTGPHSALASEAARAVACASNASVTALHVIPPDASGQERSEAKDLLKFADYVLGSDIESKTELREAPDPTDVIIEEAESHDFTAIGSPEQKFRLRDLVFEPVQEILAGRKDVTVLMGRDADRIARSLYYRYKRAMDAEEVDSDSSPLTDGGQPRAPRTDVGPILVPIFTDDVSHEALGIAVDLAEDRNAELVIIGMEAVPEQIYLNYLTLKSVSQQRAKVHSQLAKEIATSPLEITSATLVGHSVDDTILQEVIDRDIEKLVLEQTPEASSSGSLFGNPLKIAFESADCNVILSTGTKNLNGIDSILMSVAGGPHSGLAVDVAQSLAVENDAWIDVFHVQDPEASEEERDRSTEYVDAAMARLDDFERSDTWVHEASDSADDIIEQSQYYSLTILGAPRRADLDDSFSAQLWILLVNEPSHLSSQFGPTKVDTTGSSTGWDRVLNW